MNIVKFAKDGLKYREYDRVICVEYDDLYSYLLIYDIVENSVLCERLNIHEFIQDVYSGVYQTKKHYFLLQKKHELGSMYYIEGKLTTPNMYYKKLRQTLTNREALEKYAIEHKKIGIIEGYYKQIHACLRLSGFCFGVIDEKRTDNSIIGDIDGRIPVLFANMIQTTYHIVKSYRGFKLNQNKIAVKIMERLEVESNIFE